MGGKYSRSKGRRGEYMLRDHLRTLGWNADRVPLSGASQGFKGDIVATKDGKRLVFELKVRAGKYFDDIYNSWFTSVSVSPGISNTCITYSQDLDRVLDQDSHFLSVPPGGKEIKKLLNIRKWLDKSDILVIRHDRKPFIFIKYW